MIARTCFNDRRLCGFSPVFVRSGELIGFDDDGASPGGDVTELAAVFLSRACPESRILFFGNYLKLKKSWV
jgi:hypothetical protein